jgi:hypothetical protein
MATCLVTIRPAVRRCVRGSGSKIPKDGRVRRADRRLPCWLTRGGRLQAPKDGPVSGENPDPPKVRLKTCGDVLVATSETRRCPVRHADRRHQIACGDLSRTSSRGRMMPDSGQSSAG